MALNISKQIKQERQRREAGLLRMRRAFDVTQSTLKKEAVQLKSEFDPSSRIRSNPWPAVLGALAAGLVLIPLLRKMVASKGRSSSSEVPQKVVVEVVGAQDGEKKTVRGGAAKPWKSILDAAISGLPAILAFAKEHLRPKEHNGREAQREEIVSEDVVPKVNIHKSISRRTAPPPPL